MGRRFKSKDYKSFEADVCKVLPIAQNAPQEGELFVSYTFFLSNYGNTDVGNLEKQITDILVARGYIKDDRYIKALLLRKERGEDGIEVVITNFDTRQVNVI